MGSYLVAPSEDDEEDADGDIVDVVEVVDDLGMSDDDDGGNQKLFYDLNAG